MDVRRLLPFSGIAFVVLLVVSVVVLGGDHPESDGTAQRLPTLTRTMSSDRVWPPSCWPLAHRLSFSSPPRSPHVWGSTKAISTGRSGSELC